MQGWSPGVMVIEMVREKFKGKNSTLERLEVRRNVCRESKMDEIAQNEGTDEGIVIKCF